MSTKSKIQPEGADDKATVELLVNAYKKHGKQKKVADALGVSPSTVSTWLARLGYQEWAVIVPRGQQPANEQLEISSTSTSRG